MTTAPAIPTGAQHKIQFGHHHAVVVEVGGGLRSLALDGRERLDDYGPNDMAQSGRGQVLMPWPNRLRDGVYEFNGTTHQVALNEPELNNAIHGLVRWSAWSAVESSPQRVVLEHVLHAQPGYPFTLGIRIAYALGPDGLSVETTATNLGSTTLPFGAGAHPWLQAASGTVDGALLRIPAATVIEVDDRGIPVRRRPVADADLDFRVAKPIGSVRIDHAFTDLERAADGIARVELTTTGNGAVSVWLDRAYPLVQLSTGDVLPDVDRRSIAIEPMTCPPNAFQTGEALIRLEPGDTFTGTWGISPR